MLNVPVLNIVGEQSSHVDGTITFNMRVNPALCTWMKISDAGMLLEEQPEKVAEAVGLFLQGLGYTLRMGRSRSATVRPNKLPLQIKGTINCFYSIQGFVFANEVIVWNGMFIHFVFFGNFSFTDKQAIQEISRDPIILLFHIIHTISYLTKTLHTAKNNILHFFFLTRPT